MEKEEIQQLLQNHPHLKKYLESIREKMNDPVFYSILPFEARDEPYPNLIYPTQCSVFIHVYLFTYSLPIKCVNYT